MALHRIALTSEEYETLLYMIRISLTASRRSVVKDFRVTPTRIENLQRTVTDKVKYDET